jgi:hypothetical protein
MDPVTISLAALGVSTIVAFYAIFASTPKEMGKRVSTLEITSAVQARDMASLVQTVNRLARTVDKYIEYRVEHNGRTDNR